MAEKQIKYHGYIICVDKETGLTSYSVYRESDMWEIICDFTYSEDSVKSIVNNMKQRVDQFIKTRGLSEGLEGEY